MKAAFVFSGQGAQAVGMGKDIYEKSPAGKAVYDEANKVLGWDLTGICFEGPAEKLMESKYCQVAIFVTSMACLEVFKEKTGNRITPVGCAGLSLGEYAAFTASSYFQFADAVKLVAKRAELMDEATKKARGTMASVITNGEISAEAIQKICEECGIGVANYNSAMQIVISGNVDGVARATAVLKETAGVRKIIPLKVAGAYHSPMMAEAGEALAPYLEATPASAMTIPVAQNFTGKITEKAEEVKPNLIRQVAGSVQWVSCVNALCNLGADTFIEFGPGNVLTGLIKKIVPEKATFNVGNFEDPDKIIAGI